MLEENTTITLPYSITQREERMSPSVVLLFTLVSAPVPAEELVYQGTLSQVERDESTPVKEFEFTCWTDSRYSEAFFFSEEGRPALPWFDRFGVSKKTQFNSGLHIGYRHKEHDYTLPVAFPFFSEFDQIEPGAKWERDGKTYTVIAEKLVNGSDCWQIRIDTGIARYQILTVLKSNPLIVAGEQILFMGQGDKFRVKFTLKKQEQMSADRANKVSSLVNAFTELQESFLRDGNEPLGILNETQLEIANQHSPALFTLAKSTPLEPIASAMHKDLTTQKQRMNQIGELASSFVGKPAPKFTLTGLDGKPVTIPEGVTILHFWSYNDKPLEQPYGQVGYLEFLHSRWESKNVHVYGVAIDPRLNTTETRPAGLQSIRNLKRFMRLQYPVTYDSGSVLNAFGNPTRLGVELPLWVVIDPQGRIVHYQTGIHDIDPKTGLKDINAILTKIDAGIDSRD